MEPAGSEAVRAEGGEVKGTAVAAVVPKPCPHRPRPGCRDGRQRLNANKSEKVGGSRAQCPPRSPPPLHSRRLQGCGRAISDAASTEGWMAWGLREQHPVARCSWRGWWVLSGSWGCVRHLPWEKVVNSVVALAGGRSLVSCCCFPPHLPAPRSSAWAQHGRLSTHGGCSWASGPSALRARTARCPESEPRIWYRTSASRR